MARRLVGAKPLSEPLLGYSQLDPKDKIQWNISRNLKIFIQENAFENVIWKMAAILFWPHVLNQLSLNFFPGTLLAAMMTWHHLCKCVSGLSTVKKSPVKPITSIHFHIFTQISAILRGHTMVVSIVIGQLLWGGLFFEAVLILAWNHC